ncbi:hypothetical protein LEP1GSC103_0975 [Leptospira borgpetersenii serovar Javanica str. UI 09931]|uniref:Uncharacterized protein n=1 Tax=Leptospira borgpetersenii serovar Javanica str. UI 09931 TaxID=1049767 RepID=A0AAV3JG23_LEPBO|nr:hypothetical protein LEP1GSC101_0200 [Leptospira borgpetersenii str. UI 09149]EMN58968.1 hypothetical protein LEP1GSC090_2904 [Leptospira borgpetersenii serovar Javanica str. MK146]EPG59797.1 hypothetical protein LEP1GSC103_0975 [Leptospira borgpetersenii serovar Javanica str. UI 09931]
MDLGKKRQRLMKFLLKKGNVSSATKSRSQNLQNVGTPTKA